MRKMGLVVLSSVLLATALSPVAAAAPKSVFLAYQGPLTGDSESFGKDQFAAANYIVSEFNKKYRSKFKVKLFPLDDEGSDEKAVEISKSLALDNRIIGVVGPAFSNTAAISLANFAAGKLAVISPSAIREPLISSEAALTTNGLNFFHRTAASEDTQARDLFELATRGVVMPKVFVLHHEDSYSQTLANQLREIAATDVLTTELSPYTATSWASAIKRIRDEKFNVVIYLGYHPQAARFLKQLTDSGYTGIKALSDGSFSPGLLLSAPNSALEGTRLIGLTTPLNLINTSLYQAIYGSGKEARGIYASETVEATQVFLNCIIKNSLTRRKMNRCIDSYQGKSLTGELIKFDQIGNLVQRTLPRFVIKNGEFQLFTK